MDAEKGVGKHIVGKIGGSEISGFERIADGGVAHNLHDLRRGVDVVRLGGKPYNSQKAEDEKGSFFQWERGWTSGWVLIRPSSRILPKSFEQNSKDRKSVV